MPNEAEPLGLLALMLFCESRAAARRSETGAYVPLDQQDTLRWDPDLLAEAERCSATSGRTCAGTPACSGSPSGACGWRRR